jgi:hypothetical protein
VITPNPLPETEDRIHHLLAARALVHDPAEIDQALARVVLDYFQAQGAGLQRPTERQLTINRENGSLWVELHVESAHIVLTVTGSPGMSRYPCSGYLETFLFDLGCPQALEQVLAVLRGEGVIRPQ